MAEQYEQVTETPVRIGAPDEPMHEILTFSLGGKAFGVPLTQVLEILGVRNITHVPRSPTDVLGVCTVRGELVTVIGDALRLAFGHAPRAVPKPPLRLTIARISPLARSRADRAPPRSLLQQS